MLYAGYRDELDRLERWDRGLLRSHAVERLRTDLDAWHGEPVFAYGFEDLTGAEWALLEALAARTEVTVSLPYEPGRPVFAALRRTAEDLAGLASGAVEELPPRYEAVAPPALAHLERALFADEPGAAPSLDGVVRFFEGAGSRGTLELVGEEVLALARGGMPPERIGIVVPGYDRIRGALETVLGSFGIPYAVDGELRLTQTPLVHALAALLRFAWAGGTRGDLFTLPPLAVLGGRAARGRLRRGPPARAVPSRRRSASSRRRRACAARRCPALAELREAADPVEAVRELAERMLRNAYGLERPPADAASRLDLRAYETLRRLLDRARGLARAQRRADPRGRPRRDRACRASVAAQATMPDASRWSTSCAPARGASTPSSSSGWRRGACLVAAAARRSSTTTRGARSTSSGARLERPDPVEHDRYLFYTACTRSSQRLYLVREAADDDGSPREASPFWHDVAGALRRRRRAALDPPAAALGADVAARGGTDRARAPARARGARRPRRGVGAEALARANGWERRLERALTAFQRPTRLTNPLVLEQLGSRTSFA